MDKIRVLIAEDVKALLEALAALLGREPDLDIVATTLNGRDALIEALGRRPDVVLTDLKMPIMNGIDLTRDVRAQLPETAVVVLTQYDDDENLFAALKAGAICYVLKDASGAQIAEAIRSAHAGQGILSAGLVDRVVREFVRIDTLARGQRKLFAQLTRREAEVLELLASGLRNKQIAQRLSLAEKTVRNHISAILGKLHANDRTEAALIAARHGLGQMPPPDSSTDR